MFPPLDLKTDIRVLSAPERSINWGAGEELGFTRTLLVADAGMVRPATTIMRARSLEAAGVQTLDLVISPKPDADRLEAGGDRRTAAASTPHRPRPAAVPSIARRASTSCHKGGTIHDSTATGGHQRCCRDRRADHGGTGSEAQPYRYFRSKTRPEMACGDPKAAFRAVVLDPRLTLTQPRR